MKQVTVIIPNYNGKAYLDDCLTSLLQDDRTLFDVLVVDNASQDGSFKIAERFAHETDGVRLLCLEENTGFTGGVNAGIQNVKTPYVLLLNNDTRTEPGFVKALLDAAGGNDRIFSVSARMLSMREPDRLDDAGDMYCALGWAYGRGKNKSAERYRRGGQVFAACGGAALYRREALERLGGFDENHFAYLEDIDIGYRARIYGLINVYEPLAVVYHAGSGVSGSKHNPFKIRLAARNSVYLIYKNMPFLQVLINLPFLLPGFLIKAAFFLRKGYGGIYVMGLREGVRLSLSESGRRHKIRFSWRRLPAYIRLQIWLWRGIFTLLREF